MKKKMIMLALCFMCAGLVSCGHDNAGTGVNGSGSATENEQKPAETVQTELTEAENPEPTEAEQPDGTEAPQQTETEAEEPDETEPAQTEDTEAAQPDETAETEAGQREGETAALTEEQALNAIKNYCFSSNPNLKSMVDSDEYTIYWDVNTNDSNEIVVLYRSYTGALIRYYIDPVSGEAYVTEQIPGIIDEEQRTEEKLNVRDYTDQ